MGVGGEIEMKDWVRRRIYQLKRKLKEAEADFSKRYTKTSDPYELIYIFAIIMLCRKERELLECEVELMEMEEEENDRRKNKEE